MMEYQIDRALIEKLLDGEWYVEPAEDWQATHLSESRFSALGKQTLFLALDEKTWQKGTGNTGIYSKWENTHELVHEYQSKYGAIIAQYPILNIDPTIPQFITQDPFALINHFSEHIRERLESTVIAVTGTVGKTSTKDYLNELLSKFGTVYATHKNHNSRTGVKLTIANAMHNPDYLVLEAAMSALWMKAGSISRLAKPNIAIVTEIGVGQKGYDELQTADFKSRIGDGLAADGLYILNRDIKVYDQLEQYCQRFSSNILSYGLHPKSDIRILPSKQNLNLQIGEQHFEFDVPAVDDGTLHNIVAALSTAYALKLDLNLLREAFHHLEQRKSVLEIIPAKTRPIRVIDDTYNAEHLSMLNAFKYCAETFPQQRKVLIIGDIVNLEDQSQQVHESLAMPILNSQFERVATFGEVTRHLNAKLPRNKVIGHFKDAQSCADAVTKHLQDDDVILIKGSRRNSTIHNIPQLLLKNIDQPHSTQSKQQGFAYRCNFKDELDEVFSQYQTEYGLGSLVLIYITLKKLTLKQVHLEHSYIVTENVARESQRSKYSEALIKGERYTLYELLQLVLFTQRADAILALAEALFETTNQALREIRQQATALGIHAEKILNVSGRVFRQAAQYKTLQDIFLITKSLKDFPSVILNLLNTQTFVFKSKILQPNDLFIQMRTEHYSMVVGQNQQKIYIVFNTQHLGLFSFQSELSTKEYDIPYIMQYGEDHSYQAKVIHPKSPYINILADSYFGEFYTRIRKKRGQDDALQRYGYQHSFEKIAHFFPVNDINIVNLEACFSQQVDSPLSMIKPFVLDADAESTLKEFKHRHIQYLTLANNHAKDFGDAGLDYMIRQLNNENFEYIGAGLNQAEAQQYFEFTYNQETYAIFNGYWHRRPAYIDFNFYALGQQSGVACLAGLFRPIQKYKAQNPKHKVIVIAHWGIDFQGVQSAQENVAQRLIESGTDLIIGHGPHTLQPIRCINNKPIIYSLGNGVFNSNGEFEKYKALPYGMITRLDLADKKIKLYPFYADNKKTFWQPFVVNEMDFKEIYQFLNQGNTSEMLQSGLDENGYYIEMEMFQ
jgi:UDP-N-acetylmuramyl pentapeptide synthase